MESGSNLLHASALTFDFGLRLFPPGSATLDFEASDRAPAGGGMRVEPTPAASRAASSHWAVGLLLLAVVLLPDRPLVHPCCLLPAACCRLAAGNSALAPLRGLAVLSEFDVKLNGQAPGSRLSLLALGFVSTCAYVQQPKLRP